MAKKILITGASGFMGRNLKEQLADAYEIFAPTHQELELLDEEQVLRYLKQHRFDTVIHSAAHDASRNPKKNPKFILPNNLRMFFNLLRGREFFGKLVHFGSGAEYDMRHYLPKMKEDYFDTYVPADDYGFSKYLMAKYTSFISNIYDLRVFGCFGKYEDWEIRFISNAICKTLFDLPITIKKNIFFDYIYIDDLVRIAREFIDRNDWKYQHYNACTGISVDLLTLAKKVLAISGKNLEIVVREQDLKPEYSGDNQKLKNELPNFKFTPIDEAIASLYGWYETNRHLIKRELLLFDK